MHRQFLKGVKTALPAGLSLIPLGITMGLASAQVGMNWLQTGLVSGLVMSGSTHILAMGMLMEGVPVYLIIFSSFFMTLKNFIFSGTAMQRLEGVPLWRRLLCSVAICDTGSTIFCLSEDRDEYYLLGINSILLWCIIISSCAGVMMTEALPANVANSFGIATYAVFLSMIIPGIRKNFRLFLLVLFTAGLNWALRLVLSTAWALIISMLLGAFIGVYFVDMDSGEKQG